ncbi:hypothetical protein PHYSODRAFT_483905, partial [Phytophthora sojae]
AIAIACRGHVMKLFLSGKREMPCSSEVFTRMSRTNTKSALTDRFPFTTNPSSEARPNAYHISASNAASW